MASLKPVFEKFNGEGTVFGSINKKAINNQENYQKNRNYWKYLKTKLKKENNELVSLTNQLKLIYDYLNGYDAQAAYTEKDYYCPVNTERLRWMMKKVVSHASIF